MNKSAYTYIIVGAGIAGTSAIEGIREHDQAGSILMVGSEKYLPYNRPALTKDLWRGTVQEDRIFIRDSKYYEENGVELVRGTRITSIDPSAKTVTDAAGQSIHYDKLLLAMGGTPRMLPIPGGNLEGICYYRYLDDYEFVRRATDNGAAVTIIGGGFIGSELGASLCTNNCKVTMIYPREHICAQVLPDYLGRVLDHEYLNHEMTLLNNDKPVSFEKSGTKFITRTRNGKEIESDEVVVGIGIVVSTRLAELAGIRTKRGIIVDEYQQSSIPDIYAAGDCTIFPYVALGRNMHIEHWDHAQNHGKSAGRNMAGAHMAYEYLPYFFTEMYDFSYQMVGDISPDITSIPEWQEENKKGIIYFVRDNKLCGVMTSNIPDKMDWAREMVRQGTVPARLAQEVK